MNNFEEEKNEEQRSSIAPYSYEEVGTQRKDKRKERIRLHQNRLESENVNVHDEGDRNVNVHHEGRDSGNVHEVNQDVNVHDVHNETERNVNVNDENVGNSQDRSLVMQFPPPPPIRIQSCLLYTSPSPRDA